MGSSSLIDLLGAYSSLDFPGIPRDGSQDAGPGINNALKHIAARGIANGVFYLVPGTYQIRTSVNMLSNIEICGAGPATVLQLGSSVNIDLLIANQVSGWKLKNLRVDGNRANSSGTRHNIWLYKVSDACLDNVESISARYDGFRLDDCERIVFLSPRASDNGRHGISVSYSRYNQIVTPRCYDNSKVATSGDGDGINFELLSGDNTVVCPMSYETAEAGDNQGYGIREAAGEGCYRNIVLGGALVGNKTAGASIESRDSMAFTPAFVRYLSASVVNPT